MLAFINKYKRWIYLSLFALAFIVMFFPYKTYFESGINLTKFSGVIALFSAAIARLKCINLDPSYNYFRNDAERYFYKTVAAKCIVGCIILIIGIILCVLTFTFINKRYKSYSLGFILISVACIIKMYATALGEYIYNGEQFTFNLVSYGDAWTDYVIISIALLMLIVDIVRLSIYIRIHREQIAAKLSALKPPPRERKPSKDERIAELEKRVRQLEDSKKDG